MHEQTFLNIKYFQTCNCFYNSWEFWIFVKKIGKCKNYWDRQPLSLSLSQISVWVVKFSCQGVADLIS